MNKQVNEFSELEFAVFFRDLRKKILEDPIRYFVRDANFINFSPTPAQTVALKCTFGQELDGITKHKVYQEDVNENGDFELTERNMTEVDLYEQMTGFVYNGISEARNKINFIIGRRGGKSTIAAIIALYSTLKTNWTPYLNKTPVATVAILSHSIEFSKDIIDILRNLVEGSEVLSRLQDPTRKDTQSTFHLKIPFATERNGKGEIEYSRVAIKVGAASTKTTRGRAICTLLCDEIAYWNLNEDAAEPDIEIIRAVRPSLLQFGGHGTTIKLSSPAIKQGVLYDEWTRREELKDDYIQFKAPSWVWNTVLPIEQFKKEWRLDQRGFDSEYRANFVDSVSIFIHPEKVQAAIMKGVAFQPPSADRATVYSAAIDAAFKGDRFSFCVVGHNESRISTYILKYWEGNTKKPVQIHEVAAYIRAVCKEYGLGQVIADQYAFQPLRELFLQYGVSLHENPFTPAYKKKIYFALKQHIHDGKMDLLDIPLLAKEIKELQVEQTPSGQIRIGHPPGGSDDLADALAVATYMATQKSGSAQISTGFEMNFGNDYGIKTDLNGRAFTAPSPEMLHNYHGFQGVIDNSSEFVQDPKTEKWVRKSELEDPDAPGDGPDFIF